MCKALEIQHSIAVPGVVLVGKVGMCILVSRVPQSLSPAFGDEHIDMYWRCAWSTLCFHTIIIPTHTWPRAHTKCLSATDEDCSQTGVT